MSRWGLALLVVSSLVVLSLSWRATVESQEDNRPRFDPAEMRQRMLDRMKESLGASDEEWKVLSSKVEKVMSSRDATRGGMFFGGFGGRGPGGPGGPGRGGRDRAKDASDNPVVKASDELRTALDDKKTSAEDIGKKLTAFRQARDRAKEDLTKAQKELRELLTQRQEASLVLAGMLD